MTKRFVLAVRRLLVFMLVISLTAGIMPAFALAAPAEQKKELEEWGRETVNFNREWKFIRQDVENAQDVDFDDSYWFHVGIPHDFSIPYWQDTTHYTGYGWYRKNFTIDSAWVGKQIFLDFEGVFHTAELYVNGQLVGKHRGGYTGFEFDITDYVTEGENVVAVRVNNIWDATLAPRCGEHMFTGGIYRDVNLVVTSPVHVTWYGTFVQTPNISAEKANVRMQTEIKNDSDEPQKVRVVSKVYDAGENLVTEMESDEKTLQAGETFNFDDTSNEVPEPHLWCVDDPYLYKVLTEVYVENKEVDQYETPLGFRWVEWTADQGFFLNGEHLYLDGANAHQDHAGWGNAVTTEALKRDVAMIKEAGLNFIRGSHYPHSPAYAEACDEEGVLFWSEAAFWGTGSRGEGGSHGNSEDYKADSYPTIDDNGERAAFEQSCLENIRDMIRVNRNHPSIIVWSMGNEVFFGTNHDKKKALISKMAAYAKELDPTRATAMGGTQRGGYDKLENVDVAGYNGDGAKMSEFQNPGVANMVAEYASHTGNRPDSFRAYYGDVATDTDGNPIEYEWRSGQSLWCAFHHGSIASRSYGDMGFIDYYRLPLQTWYYYRYKNTGVARENSISGTAAKLALEASDLTISNDGTQDSHIIVTVQDKNGNWINATPEVTLEIVDGPGVFPTGKTMTFVPGDSMRDGKAAIEFRSYYAGKTTIQASAEGLQPAVIEITTTGSGTDQEPDINTMYGTFMGEGGYIANPIQEPALCKFVDYSGSPLTASSGNESRLNVLDGDASTEWTADIPGSNQWLYLELEHGGMSLYKAKLTFNGKVYPYKIQYKELNIDEPEWKTLVEYDGESVQTRPTEESFYGTYMRYFRIEFTDVPDDEYANLADIRLYGIRAETKGYETGYQYLSNLEWKSASGAGNGVRKDTSVNGNKISVGGNTYKKGFGVLANSEIVYDLDKVTSGFARFQCTVGIDSEVSGNPNVTIQVYGDNQLMYEKKLTDKQDVFDIDVSVSKVKELKLTATANGANTNNHVDWANARLIGALRDISADEESMEAVYFANTETLVPGGSYEIAAGFANKKEEERKLAAALTLYDRNGEIVSVKMGQTAVSGKSKSSLDMKLKIPEDIPVGSSVTFMVWDEEDLTAVTDIVTASRVVGDPEKDKYQDEAEADDEDGYWVTVAGDDVNKSDGWGRWTPANGSISGYETYVDHTAGTNWKESWIEQEFTGSQVKVYAKKDGSQYGANIYIDGVLITEVSTKTSEKDSYSEVFDSGKLDFDKHVIRIEPTGKFGFDCIRYYTEDRLVEPPVPSQGYNTEVKVYGKEESLIKNGSWGYWTPSAGASLIPEGGYETYIDNWQNSSLELSFIGVQVSVSAKLDGSKVGADVYIDGKMVASVDTKKSPDSYEEVFQSEELAFGEHTIVIKPTGKFGFDYISFNTGEPEDRTELLAAVEQCSQMNSADYAEGWDEFLSALKTAVKVSKKPGYTQKQIEEALDHLESAKEALVLFVEREEKQIREAIKNSLNIISQGEMEKYSADIRKNFTGILLNAVDKLNGKGLPQEELNQAAAALQDSLDALQESVSDKESEELQKQLEEAKKALEEAEKALKEAEKAAAAAKAEKERAEREVSDLKRQLESLKLRISLVKGKKYISGNLIYKVLNVQNQTVTVSGTDNRAIRKLTIPDTVEINGIICRITEIEQSAFKECKKLSSVTLGKNITKIGKQSFYGCAKLKKIYIKSENLKTVGAKAFGKTYSKADIYVPKKKITVYRKLLKKGGIKNSAKLIKKYGK